MVSAVLRAQEGGSVGGNIVSPHDRLCGERAERGVIGVDLNHAATIPDDADDAAVVDVLDDPAVPGVETAVGLRVGDELDPGSDGDTRFDAGC